MSHEAPAVKSGNLVKYSRAHSARGNEIFLIAVGHVSVNAQSTTKITIPDIRKVQCTENSFVRNVSPGISRYPRKCRMGEATRKSRKNHDPRCDKGVVGAVKFHYPEMHPVPQGYIIPSTYFSFQILFHTFFPRIPHARDSTYIEEIIFRTRSTVFTRDFPDFTISLYGTLTCRKFARPRSPSSMRQFRNHATAVINCPARAARFARWKIAVRPPYKVSALAGTLNAGKKIRNCARRKKKVIYFIRPRCGDAEDLRAETAIRL